MELARLIVTRQTEMTTFTLTLGSLQEPRRYVPPLFYCLRIYYWSGTHIIRLGQLLHTSYINLLSPSGPLTLCGLQPVLGPSQPLASALTQQRAGHTQALEYPLTLPDRCHLQVSKSVFSLPHCKSFFLSLINDYTLVALSPLDTLLYGFMPD